MNPLKRPHKKVRTGCTQCKQRRIKCDESKPLCHHCQRSKARCSFSVFAYSAKEASLPIISAVAISSEHQDPLYGSVNGCSLSLCDLELMHHFTVSTSQTVGSNGELQRTMQEVVPRLALSEPYLMHAVLALSALHLDCMRPLSSRHYWLPALQHYSNAIPAFRTSLQLVTEKNCHALFAFAHLITKSSFAILACTQAPIFSPESEITADFISHLQGGFSVYDTAFEWLASGPLKDCLEAPVDADQSFESYPHDAKLARLLPHLNSGNEECDIACREALNDLRRVFAMISAPNQTISTKTLVYCWLARLSSRFIVLMNKQNPEALIVLAHYSVMLNLIDEYWFMKGWGIRLLEQCQSKLCGPQLELISWPLEVLGLQPSGVVQVLT
ncbi:hypothetical protein BP6252_13866 [Coleophoma cylindrospora]|uniref:Zn(2)-C6 fungal-type domain-containing protein n=1 Tax=Coleophoma cylindrospora TaxID=1849047 RepID=A0A3D8Q623_9HELO|nr:hypothetical protein BP6252_13866 [Coleophoma cylindrospora]